MLILFLIFVDHASNEVVAGGISSMRGWISVTSRTLKSLRSEE